MSGKLIILSAPSGAGKTTIVKHLIQQDMNLEFSISACNREKRKREIHGKDYYFLTVNEFKAKISDNEFIEWEEVYKNQYYGTLKSEVDRIWENGNTVIFDVDVMGGINIKKQFKNKALAIFVMPPSLKELKKRLKNRSSEPEDVIKKRIEKAEKELTYFNRFDKIILNKNLKDTFEEVEKIVKEFIA